METTSRPTALIFGCILAGFIAAMTLYSIASWLSPSLPIIGHSVWVGPYAPLFSAIFMMVLSAGVYLVCAISVYRGDEWGRTLFLIWACVSLILGMSLNHYSPFVLIEAAFANLILLSWFVPGSSAFLIPNLDGRLTFGKSAAS